MKLASPPSAAALGLWLLVAGQAETQTLNLEDLQTGYQVEPKASQEKPAASQAPPKRWRFYGADASAGGKCVYDPILKLLVCPLSPDVTPVIPGTTCGGSSECGDNSRIVSPQRLEPLGKMAPHSELLGKSKP